LSAAMQVLPSYGHIRDLPSKTGSVKPEEDFSMIWSYLPRSYPKYKEIEDAVRKADRVCVYVHIGRKNGNQMQAAGGFFSKQAHMHGFAH